MKREIVILLGMLVLVVNTFGQFKNIHLKKIKSGKEFVLRAYKVEPINDLNDDYFVATGKIPGKPELAFFEKDNSGKLNFIHLARFWSKKIKANSDNEYNLRLIANSIVLPKEYKENYAKETYIKKSETEIILIRKFGKKFNTYENDSIEMIQITYLKVNNNFNNEVIIFDLVEIGEHVDDDKAMTLVGKFTDKIKSLSIYYNKKWNVEGVMELPFGYNKVETNLAFMQEQIDGSLNFYKLDIQTGNLTGGGFIAARHIKRNFWVNLGYSNFGSNSLTFDSLYRRGYYYEAPVLYNARFTCTPINSFKVGIEKRFFIGRNQSVDIVVGGIYSLPITFELTTQTSVTSPETKYSLNYKEALGFEFGCNYRYLLKRHNVGFVLGWKSITQKFNYRNYKVNGVSGDINTAPYFLGGMKKYDISGFEILFGVTYQF